ncbi:hypothetical protein CCZ20_27115 [Priestia aryabhattai]|uniref:DUF6944 family repetitive protein n=1 Tax=Priestia aryabhattai TaxID=412384 RepID=UPI000B502FB8|nr:hypothetical protein [Priestia aryabhattai]MBZ6489362.1 hypothetical protein [Priestia aryabhattai]OVE34339.1 hypothetical protein CCZ20_27115 [Priestia aryabhattai]
MDNQLKEIFGAWLAAIGTVTAAVGSTPFRSLGSSFRKDLNLLGNELQAVGNALEADGQGEENLERLGNELQSVGNVTVISGLVVDFKDTTQQKLIITGNWIQALGGATALGDEFQDTSNINEIYNIIGNLLQVIGNSLQALSGINELKASYINNKESSEKEEDNNSIWSLDVVGSWIQAIGSVISLIGQIQEESEEQNNENEENDSEDSDDKQENLTQENKRRYENVISNKYF